jgi:hypothetical protein
MGAAQSISMLLKTPITCGFVRIFTVFLLSGGTEQRSQFALRRNKSLTSTSDRYAL